MEKDVKFLLFFVLERVIYGFVLCLLCYVLFVIYLIWVYILRLYQEWMGFIYWLNKFFVVVIFFFLCVLFLGSFIIYEGLIFINIVFVDFFGIILVFQKENYDYLFVEIIIFIEELLIIDVNKFLYSI